MPLVDLLNPIPGAKRGGENLRYAGLYDKAKEARREDEDIPSGAWATTRKKADYKLVDKLCSDALINKSKDLWCAAWLTEAWLRTKGVPGLLEGLQLTNGLIENFWEDLYPELEDGDAELRATPLEWIGSQLEMAIRNCRLTSKGLTFLQQKEAKTVGYEADCEGSDEKAAARAQAIADGKITGEDWDAGFAATPKSFYVTLLEQVDACTAELDKLDASGGKFGDASPSFGSLRTVLDEYRQAANSLLNKKRETEPDEETAEEDEAAAVEVEAEAAGEGTAVARSRVKPGTIAEPEDEASALKLIFLGARYLRKENPSNPAPYQMLRALRFGRLRESGSVDSSQLEAPPTEVRKKLKALAMDAAWADVLETAESALETNAGAAWLDLHRYAARACDELGRPGASAAIKAEVRSMLMDFPALKEISMNDDTPTAGPETLTWLRELSAPAAPSADEVPPLEEKLSEAAPDVIDPYEMAKKAAVSGHPQDAIEILSREAAKQRCGRDRFHRRVQLAQVCMSADYYALAQPILQELYEEIEARHLTDWETPELVGHALGLLYRCLNKNGGPDEQRQKVYTKLCRFDPVLALQFSK
jgi:type VI secretion system protein ImpA